MTSSEGDNNGGLVIRHLDDAQDVIDPRISTSLQPHTDDLESGSTRHDPLSGLIHHDRRDGDLEKRKHAEKNALGEERLYVEFGANDDRDPINFSYRRKWTITITACLFTSMASAAASTYSMGIPSMMQDLSCTQFQANIGISLYPLGFGIVPLVSASFSEEFGRQPLYIGSTIGFLLMNVMIALAKNVQTVIIGRFLAGGFGSTGATMVGGTIADIWRPHQRGLPMATFTVAVLLGTGMGPVVAGWVEMNPHLQWRWIEWLHVIISGAFLLVAPVLLQETRSSVLLARLVRRIRKQTGDNRYRARVEDERASMRTLIYISCTRPLRLLLTEPVVFSFSLWLAFTWGILYCMIESVGPIFKNLHGFNSGQEGTVFVGAIIGVFLGFATDFYQESLYQKYFNKRGPEARLYSACGAAFLLPVGMFIYAWSSFAKVHWIALVIGITVFFWALFIIFLVAFIYLADCYGPFASSALAGQSLLRNILGMAFPLFTQQMYSRLTYQWSSTLFASIAVLMIPIPYVLFCYGPAIRARSRFSRVVMQSHMTP